MAENPPAVTLIVQRHPPKSASVDVRNLVMPGEPFVQERVTGIDEVEHAAVFAENVLKQELRLPPEGLPQVVVEVRKQAGIGCEGIEVAKV